MFSSSLFFAPRMKSGSRRIANKQHLISLVVWCVCTRKRQWSTILPLRDKYQCVVARNDTGRKERLKTRICTLFLSTSPPFYRLPPLAFMVFSISGRIGLVRDRATTTTTAITSQIQSLMHTSTSSVSHIKFFSLFWLLFALSLDFHAFDLHWPPLKFPSVQCGAYICI